MKTDAGNANYSGSCFQNFEILNDFEFPVVLFVTQMYIFIFQNFFS